MDKLKTFLKSMPMAARHEFAERCGTSYAHMRNVAYESRVAGEKLCVAIERESEGEVTRADLRDDWAEIWPELAEHA